MVDSIMKLWSNAGGLLFIIKIYISDGLSFSQE